MPKLSRDPAILGRFRRQLAEVEAVPQLALLGLILGILTGLVIAAFRFLISEGLEGAGLSSYESFEELSPLLRFLLPLGGAISIALLFSLIPAQNRRVGIVHVIEQLSENKVRLPFANFIAQFIGGVLALASGQSCGREGPAVHLGAGVSSALGDWLKLPNNSIRILIGCGSAAAISAAFNTPIAGVIFAMEVILLEYTISSFIPVLLASAAGAIVTTLLFGGTHAFIVPSLDIHSLAELPFLFVCGALIGMIAALFISLSRRMNRYAPGRLITRFTLAGLICACLAVFFPQIMGVGYDTISQVLNHELAWSLLAALLVAKFIASIASCGLGLPGGVIGPCLFIGACLGASLGAAASLIYADSSSLAFYAMLGMGAMMAAVLQAPLAALIAVMELTNNANILLPSIIVIVSACLCSRYVFKQKSIFASLLAEAGIAQQYAPINQALQRVGVTSVMETSFIEMDAHCSDWQIQAKLGEHTGWIILLQDGKPSVLTDDCEIRRYLAQHQQSHEQPFNQGLLHTEQCKQLISISAQATLLEAHQILSQSDQHALSVRSPHRSDEIIGLVTGASIQHYYQLHSPL